MPPVDAYGQLDGKWSDFPGKPKLKRHHAKLLTMRDTLLAHNDLSPHRATVFGPEAHGTQIGPRRWKPGRLSTPPASSRFGQLFAYQEERFGQHLQKLVERLQDVFSWPDGREIELEHELERLGADRAPQDSPAPSPTDVEDGALQDDP